MIDRILNKNNFTKDDIIILLKADTDDTVKLLKKANEVKNKTVGNKVYYRGLIEFSNICRKDCYYCGIRKSNHHFKRYNLSDAEIINAAEFAYSSHYGSIVLQSGELQSDKFTARIENLLKTIKLLSDNKLGITISLGEQTAEVYKRWYDAGAHRYLLRIESTNPDLYYKIHPKNELHSHKKRKECLYHLKRTGYQTGTGVMIGLPFQSYSDLADDILFMKELDIDMCGMGPYIEHKDTPLYNFKDLLSPLRERFVLSLKMIAILRLLMPDINIAASTAMQAIDPLGREKAIMAGANIIMPNITPGTYRDDYSLYENKPCTGEEASDCKNCLEARIRLANAEVGYGEWGDSLHFLRKNKAEFL